MSFFEGLPPTPPPPEPRQPAWAGPPPGVVPGVSSQQVVLFKSDMAEALLHHLLAYPTGVEFSVNFWFRSEIDGRELSQELRGGFYHGDDPPSEDGWRFGVEYPDGSVWTNVSRLSHRFEESPSSMVMVPQRGGGGGYRWTQGFWMWPLPDEGTVRFVVSWPVMSVDEHSVTIDASELRELANESQELWPTDHE